MSMNRPVKVMHIITDLKMGGAEMALFNLLSGTDRSSFHSKVVALSDDKPVGDMIRNMGIDVHSLNARPGIPDPRMILRLRKEILAYSPDVIQTWMYHADFAGAISNKLAGKIPVVWGIHHTLSERNALKPTTYLVARVNALLSRFIPAKIVCVAYASRKTHSDFGYHARKLMVISNGIDTRHFRPSPDMCGLVRMELGLPEGTPLIGLCARYDPLKDHHTFLRAASLLASEMPEVHYVLWGENVDPRNLELIDLLERMNLSGCVRLLGIRSDGARLFAAMDVMALSSISEAQPQALGEAMACGVPCTSTDVGDCAKIVGDTGLIVPSRNPAALAEAWKKLLSMKESERKSLGVRARQRIIDHYSLDKMTASYCQLYRDIITGAG